MRRRTDPEEAPPLPPHGVAPPPAKDDTRPCPGCKASTSPSDLATYGNRCQACYRSFCGAVGGRQLQIADKRTGGPLAWAQAIVQRHRSGHAVSAAARTMAQDALKARSMAGSEDDEA